MSCFLATIYNALEKLQKEKNLNEKIFLEYFLRISEISCLEDLKVLKEKEYIYFDKEILRVN